MQPVGRWIKFLMGPVADGHNELRQRVDVVKMSWTRLAEVDTRPSARGNGTLMDSISGMRAGRRCRLRRDLSPQRRRQG